MKGKSKFFSVLVTILVLFSAQVKSQIPSDLSRLKSSQISDTQLLQFVQQAQASGKGEAELINELQKRGLPDSEMQLLSARLKNLMGNSGQQTEQPVGENFKIGSNKRNYSGETTTFRSTQKESQVFGSELFISADPLFVPNLKLATPKGYVIGAEDELQLDIYGNNISSQKMMVSPDGFIMVKYAGPVNVNGMTIEQASGVLKARLTRFYPDLVKGNTKLQLTLGSVRSIMVSVIGAVRKPGTVTLPSIATLFNALYASGGPADNGSFRKIELVRNNKVIAVADLYDFLMKGDQSSNLSLHDNDVIRVPFAEIQVTLDGALNRSGIFELKSNEVLRDALDFAGGFREGAFQGRITGYRYTDVQRTVIDIPMDEYRNFKIMNGDYLTINKIVDKFDNRVYLNGAVSKPGFYALEKDLDIKGLIAKASGFADGAFLGRAILIRLNEDLSRDFIDIDLRKHMKGEQRLMLQKNDSLHVFLQKELKEIPMVGISGAVKSAGEFEYQDSLTLEGLILKAGGFLESSLVSNIEIARRKKVLEPGRNDVQIAEIIKVEVSKKLEKNGTGILLMPYDQVSVRIDPAFVPQKKVTISGKVLFPGSYVMETNADFLSNLIKRSGGLLPIADIDAIKLIRRNRGVKGQEVKRVAEASIKSDSVSVDDTAVGRLSGAFIEVSLNVKKALDFPGSKDDILLEEGDELYIPQINYVVTISGEVQKPLSVQFEVGLRLKQYIDQTGGYTISANKRKAIVVYPNGTSAVIKHPMGIFQIVPKLKPGSTIFVPKKEERKVSSFDPAKAGILVSALSAVMTGLVLLFR